MKQRELIKVLETFKPEQEIRIYRDFPDGKRRAVIVERVVSVNTITREEKGLPEFILIGD